MKRSPFAPKKIPAMPHIEGVSLNVWASHDYYKNRNDVLAISLPENTRAAAVFTQSQTCAAPVELSKQHLKITGGKVRGLVVNAGCANAFTGAAGTRAAVRTAQAAAQSLSCAPEHIMLASTGVIGQDLNPTAIIAGLKNIKPLRHDRRQNWQAAARTIVTTDTYPKLATQRVKFGKHIVSINAIAKGSGMIAPDMATMLAFVFTDAAIPAALLQKILRDGCDKSLNAISVDSDTSTSDTCLLFATAHKKLGGAPLRSWQDKRLRPFIIALEKVLTAIALQVVGDGEGISRLMTIDVRGARNDAAARRIALAIGNSPLVKTAVAGGDANWGRIVMAVGKAGEVVSRDRLAIDIGGNSVARRGRVALDYNEALVTKHFQKRQIHIAVDVGAKRKGQKEKGQARVWASDLTHGYVKINADYRS